MNNETSYKGTFYLKNGTVIEKTIIVNIKEGREGIERLMEKIKRGFDNDNDFQFIFGYTIFRGKDLSAVTIMEIPCER